MLFSLNLAKPMRTNRISWIASTLLAMLLFSCQPDHVEPSNSSSAANEAPTLYGDANPHPDPDEICSGRVPLNLIDQYGNGLVSYCGGQPCPPNQTKWGTVEYLNSEDEFVMNVIVAAGWYIDVINTFAGAEGDLTLVNGIPQIDNSWRIVDVNPLVNATQIRIAGIDLNPNFQVVNKIVIYKNDALTGNVDPLSVTDVYAFNDKWNDLSTPPMNTLSPMIYSWEFIDCPPLVKTVTKGSCHRCDSENTVDFLDCDEINVNSCKSVTNVVLVYDDCTWEKFDNLNITTGTYSGTGANAGKTISQVYIKSGCNDSYEGPDFGRRFDSPCVNQTCGSNFNAK